MHYRLKTDGLDGELIAFCYWAAHKFKNHSHKIEPDDLFQMAWIAAKLASHRYDKSKSGSLYKYIRSKGTYILIDMIRSTYGRKDRQKYDVNPLSLSVLNNDLELIDSLADYSWELSRIRCEDLEDHITKVEHALGVIKKLRDREIMGMRLIKGMTLKAIAEVLGLSEVRISQIIKVELPKIKDRLAPKQKAEWND